jgi:APA family basic amino acid/polyamine antiporter
MSGARLRSELTLFDVTNLVVGGIIGADIYVASSFGAGYLGPFSLVIWVVAGIVAIVIALCFAQCASLLPRVGGPYAYAKEAWGPFAGFTVGWSLWLGEWVSLAVFPVAFTRYLMFFFPNLHWTYQVFVKGLFVVFLTVTNIVGVKAAGRTNDVLTLFKLTPLIFFSGIGIIYMVLHPGAVMSNLSPFLPFGLSNFGKTLVLVFWAYAGFELSTIPADKVKDASRTIPKAIVFGIAIVTIFYLTTNMILFSVRPSNQLALDTAPLASATTSVLETGTALALIGGTFVGAGALVSVTGSDESGMLGTSRLGYALAADGLFPHFFAKNHPKYKTPYLGIIFQASTALLASIVGHLDALISTSVFLMAIAYVATSASIFTLRKESRRHEFDLKHALIPSLGVLFSLFLISQCGIDQIVVGLVLVLLGVPVYVKYSPKKEMAELKEELLSTEFMLQRAYRQEERFLAYMLRRLKRLYEKRSRKRYGPS